MLRGSSLANSEIKISIDSYLFIVPSSGSVAANGTITLTTALDATYPAAYMYFPAGAYTGSTAGFYYVVMSTTTAGQMYTTKYTSGVPTTPTSPTAVSTGAGAYTQTTGSYIVGQTLTLPGGTLTANGYLELQTLCTVNNTANFKYSRHSFGASTLVGMGLTSANITGAISKIVNKNSLSSQGVYVYNGANSAASALVTVNTAVDQTYSSDYYLATATDWIVCQWFTAKAMR